MRGIKSTVLRKISIQVLTLECTEFFDTSFLKGELPNLLNARMDHCWSQIFQKRFLKSICLYLTTTKYDIRRNFLPGAWGRWYKMSIQPLMFPFILFLFLFLRTKSMLTYFPTSPSLLMSTTQQSLFSYTQFWRSKLSKLFPKPQSGCDLIQNRRRHVCDVFTPSTKHHLLGATVGYWISPRVMLSKSVGSLYRLSQRDYRAPVTFSSAS